MDTRTDTLADLEKKGLGIELAIIDVDAFQNGAHQVGLIGLIQDGEVFRVTEFFGMFAQEAHTKTMEGREGHALSGASARGLANQFHDAFFQFPGGLASKRKS